MKGVKLLAILVGAAVDVYSTQALLTQFFVQLLLTRQLSLEDFHQAAQTHSAVLEVPGTVLGGLGSFIGGFITGRMARTAEIKNTFLMGIVSSSAGFLLSKSITPWYFVFGTVVTLVAATSGGYLAAVLTREENNLRTKS